MEEESSPSQHFPAGFSSEAQAFQENCQNQFSRRQLCFIYSQPSQAEVGNALRGKPPRMAARPHRRLTVHPLDCAGWQQNSRNPFASTSPALGFKHAPPCLASHRWAVGSDSSLCTRSCLQSAEIVTKHLLHISTAVAPGATLALARFRDEAC